MAVARAGGPGKFFAMHPVAFVASLLGAAGAGAAFAVRARRVSGARRLGWIALALFELIQFVGIARARAAALSSSDIISDT